MHCSGKGSKRLQLVGPWTGARMAAAQRWLPAQHAFGTCLQDAHALLVGLVIGLALFAFAAVFWVGHLAEFYGRALQTWPSASGEGVGKGMHEPATWPSTD